MTIQLQKRQPLPAAVTRSSIFSVITAAFLWGLYPIFWKATAIEVNQAIAACVPNSDRDGTYCTP